MVNMKRENLISYMADPASLNQSSLTEVEELIQSFPYFQTAHMLLARNHHNLDSLKFHDMLRSASAFAGDRTVLYRLIHSPPTDSTLAEKESSNLSGRLAEILKRESPESELEIAPAYIVEDIPVISEVPDISSSSIEEYSFTGWFDHIQEGSEESEQEMSPEPGSGEQNLVDKFLDESPGIKPDPESKIDKSDRSESSSEANDTLMTETLAKIYANQGKFRKAIYAYEKLSLKYPEKSTYFASQINRIKSNLEENI